MEKDSNHTRTYYWSKEFQDVKNKQRRCKYINYPVVHEGHSKIIYIVIKGSRL